MVIQRRTLKASGVSSLSCSFELWLRNFLLDAQIGDSFILDLTGQVGSLQEGEETEVALLVDAATADLLNGVQVDHSPDERQWVSTALHSQMNLNSIFS